MGTSDGDGPPPTPDETPSGGRGDRRAYLYLADRLAALRKDHEQLTEQVTWVAASSAEILPRLDDLEQAVERVGAALGLGEADVPGIRTDDLTPATRWSHLDRDSLETAWNALGDWVAQVLNGEYLVSRLELPDCWPVHRRAVRELAWLRSLHVATQGSGVSVEVVGEWHTRWLPAALHNIATAIDPLECAPGRHRVTDAERRRYHRQMEDAGAGPVLALTNERGADRPRYFPDEMPSRRGQQEDLDAGSIGRQRNDPPPLLDERTPAPLSTPELWWKYFLDARMDELSSRSWPSA